MKKIRLVVERRELCGSSASGRLRRSEIIPAVIYGPSGAKNLQILRSDFRKMMKEKGESASLLELICGSETYLAMMQAVQRNPRKDDYLHVDFKEIDPKAEMTATIPLHFTGEPAGVKNEGGILDIARHTIVITCLPDDLPECIHLDISSLGVGHAIHTKDLPKSKGITYKTHADEVIVSCTKADESESEEPVEEEAPVEEK